MVRAPAGAGELASPRVEQMRRFVVIGQKTTASEGFLLDDLPGTSGRLDLLLRCVRAALLYSHGVRKDTVVYLVLLAGWRAPRSLRFDGAAARFVRPDERSLATLVQKVLASRGDDDATGFVDVKQGVAVARGGLDAVLADIGQAAPFVLDEHGTDLRDTDGVAAADVAFFVGDHLGFDEPTRARLEAIGARAVRVGPVSVHAEDAITIVVNELDRRSPPCDGT
jgi:tRNA (pseudouridine54-N1)-methyltransferase